MSRKANEFLPGACRNSSAMNALHDILDSRQAREEIEKRPGAPKINVYSIRRWHIGRAEEYDRSLTQELVILCDTQEG